MVYTKILFSNNLSTLYVNRTAILNNLDLLNVNDLFFRRLLEVVIIWMNNRACYLNKL